MSKLIQIFKPGQHTAMCGVTLSFTESDLAASAAAYDPAKHEAPIVVGHPKTDDPAYGWVKSLAFSDVLTAEPHQVDPDFAELVRTNRYKKVSASFYPPNSPSNPVPGVYYLRHVGFLGAQPPAVKGLKNAEFADADTDFIEFSEYDNVQNASLWRNLREFFIGKFGQDEADKTIPGYAVQQLEQAAQDELREAAAENDNTASELASPGFHEPQLNPGDDMSVEDKARLAELEEENRLLKQQQADFAEAGKASKAESDHAAHLAFAEGLVTAGRLLPPQKDLAVAMLDFMAGQEQAVEFGEGDGKKTLIEAFKADLLGKLPKQIEFGELTGGQDAASVDFADPNALVAAATRYQSEQAAAGITVSDIVAIQHVRGTHV